MNSGKDALDLYENAYRELVEYNQKYSRISTWSQYIPIHNQL